MIVPGYAGENVRRQAFSPVSDLQVCRMLMGAGVGVWTVSGFNKLGNTALKWLNGFIKADGCCKYLKGAYDVC